MEIQTHFISICMGTPNGISTVNQVQPDVKMIPERVKLVFYLFPGGNVSCVLVSHSSMATTIVAAGCLGGTVDEVSHSWFRLRL